MRLTIVSQRPESEVMARELDAIVVPSVEAGLQSQPGIAIVCSVSSAHARDLSLLMPGVQALYMEKPLVIDRVGLAAVRALLDAGWNKPTVVGCNLRYLGAVRKLKQALDDGVAGRPARASLQVGQWLPDWRPGRDYREAYAAKRAQGGGVIFDLVHELDSARFLFGEIAHGQAAAGNSGALDIDSDDAATIALMMQGGLPVQVSLDYVSRKPVREYLVVGELATLRVDIIAKQITVEAPGQTHVVPTNAADWDIAGTYKVAMAELIEAWRTGASTAYSLRDALPTTEWMLALEASAWRMNNTPPVQAR